MVSLQSNLTKSAQNQVARQCAASHWNTWI